MAITKLKTHDSHEVSALRVYDSPHYGELRCRDCNKHIQWLSKTDYQQITHTIYKPWWRQGATHD